MNKHNNNQWSRPKTGGLYLIELRQRLARGKTLRQHCVVQVRDLNLLKRSSQLLNRLSTTPATPVEVA